MAAAPLPEATFDTSNNVDRETAAMLSALPPDQQAQYLAAAAAVQQSDSATPAGSGAGAGQAGSSNTTSTTNAAAAVAELLSVFETLKTSIADGSMERNTGYQTLDLSATVM